jgi:hypothetical protein
MPCSKASLRHIESRRQFIQSAHGETVMAPRREQERVRLRLLERGAGRQLIERMRGLRKSGLPKFSSDIFSAGCVSPRGAPAAGPIACPGRFRAGICEGRARITPPPDIE